MSFDKDLIASGPARRLVRLDNDLMPHNFVIVQPGTLEEIGLLPGRRRIPKFAVAVRAEFAARAGRQQLCSRAFAAAEL
jgi:hypothetical protein